jgi:hypothetical protein
MIRFALGALLALSLLAGVSGQDKPNPFSRKRDPTPSAPSSREEAPPESKPEEGNKATEAELRRKFAHAVGLEVKLGVESDLSRERLTEMAELFASFSDDMWFATEGNFYIKSVVATDQSKAGNVRVFASEVDKNFTRGGGITHNPGSPGAYMEVAGKCSVFTFVHEAGHLFFSLPDEYKTGQKGGCPECLMVGGNMEGFGPGKWKFCTSANHTDKGEPCWDRIRKKHPNVKFPNPGFPPEPPFKTDVTVNNTGK